MNYFERVNQHYLDKLEHYAKPHNAEVKRLHLYYVRIEPTLNSMDYFETTKLDKKLKNIYPRGKVFHRLLLRYVNPNNL